jgi:hypothetical protein
MKVSWVFLAATVLGLCLAPNAMAGGSPNEDIPLDSWVYDAVFELSTQGHFVDLLLLTRPYRRGEIADAVRAMSSDPETREAGQAILLERLRREFAEELAPPSSPGKEQLYHARLGGGPNVHINQMRHGVSRNRLGFDATGSFDIQRTVTVRMRLRMDTDGGRDTQFHGEYWKADSLFSAWVDQAVLTVNHGGFSGAFGREFWRWGRSPQDAMLMSDHSPPFDGLRLMYRARNWSFAFHAAALDGMPVSGGLIAQRYLAGHRFNWRPRRNLEIAISEVIVFGGVDRRWEWHYLNPFLPYYWEQLNQDTNDNPLWNLEWSWRPARHLEVYGEWLIDDFQIDFTSEPHQIGVLAGLAWAGGPQRRLFVNAEYERINTYVYGQSIPYNSYYHFVDGDGNPIGIGSDLGPDADRIVVRPRWHLSRYLDITARLEDVRHGEDRIDTPQAVAVPKGTPFPSGTVARQTMAGIGVHAQVGGNFVGDVLVGYARQRNVANIDDWHREGPFIQLRLTSALWRTVRL